MTLAEQHLKIANRMKSQIFMLYADLDNLKHINDTFGHQEGDTALKDTAQILRETFREADIVSRIGGDEFVVMQLGNSEKGVKTVNSRLQNNFNPRNGKKDSRYALSLSIRVKAFPPAFLSTAKTELKTPYGKTTGNIARYPFNSETDLLRVSQQ